MLDIKNLHVNYGKFQALMGVDFHMNEGEIVALLGANGAGKTTTLHTISGLIRAKTGKIVLDGTDIDRKSVV